MWERDVGIGHQMPFLCWSQRKPQLSDRKVSLTQTEGTGSWCGQLCSFVTSVHRLLLPSHGNHHPPPPHRCSIIQITIEQSAHFNIPPAWPMGKRCRFIIRRWTKITQVDGRGSKGVNRRLVLSLSCTKPFYSHYFLGNSHVKANILDQSRSKNL